MTKQRCINCGCELEVDKEFSPAPRKVKVGKLGTSTLRRYKCPNNCGFETTIKVMTEKQKGPTSIDQGWLRTHEEKQSKKQIPE